jgi:iron(III) transport system substrate-binding protein
MGSPPMQRFLTPSIRTLTLTMTLALVFVACAPAQPTVSPPKAATEPVPTAAAKPVPRADWQADWDQTVAAARREGVLTISDPPGQSWRDVLISFEKDYPGISLELYPAFSRDFWSKVLPERQAEMYLWDLRVGGAGDPDTLALKQQGIYAPIRPLLVLPEVLDDSKWFGGIDGLWADNEKTYWLKFHGNVNGVGLVNRDFLPESELRTAQDLLNPQWQGKIVLDDPRGGGGLGRLTFMIMAFGEDFVRTLLTKQDITVTADGRQSADWFIRGRYPIALGIEDHLKPYYEQGLGRNVKQIDGPESLSPGFGGVQLLDRAPHPNASKVFINWLLTPGVQAQLATATGLNSLRLDVPPGDPLRAVNPAKANQYVLNQDEVAAEYRIRAQQLALSSLGG